MELNKLHVDQFRAGLISERMTVAGIFPTVARDLVGATDSAGREHDGLGAKNLEAAAFAFVSKCADDTLTIFEQRENRVFHVNLDPLMNSMIL